jgi:predicted metalloprotease with PDZ domain
MRVQRTATAWLIALAMGWTADLAAAEIPAAQDVDYPGAIELAVDATDIGRRIFRAHEQLPVTAGPLTLLYPKWLPGDHAPTGPIAALAGVEINAGGRRIDWQRDPVDMYAFHLEVPPGIEMLEIDLEFLSPVLEAQGRQVMTPDILNVQWEKMLLYPAGHFARRIRIRPTLTLPQGWELATSLATTSKAGAATRFEMVTLETLVDSPVFAGRHFVRFDLSPATGVTERLNIVADRPANLEAEPDQVVAHGRLLREAQTLFAGRPYRKYDFLLALSANLSGIGLEHLESSENAVAPGYFTDWDEQAYARDLLPHELVHSWNGKFRRPADLTTANYNEPMQDSLLWVYEGMTEYWGYVLAARSGLWDQEFAHEALAWLAATYDRHRPGRAWRDLADTTNQPIIEYKGSLAYPSWQRSADYYAEGLLLWLDVDTKLRELTRKRRSLDDFAAAFFAVEPDRREVLTYTFDDIVSGLAAVAPYDWRSFLESRLQGLGHEIALRGFERSGWRVVYSATPSAYAKSRETVREFADFAFSIGLVITNEGAIVAEVIWDSPAHRAGIAPGMTVVAVDEVAYTKDLLAESIAAARANNRPIEILVRSYDRNRTVRVAYRDGPRHPHLERIDGQPDLLGSILKPRT